jgi:hypothetical protein
VRLSHPVAPPLDPEILGAAARDLARTGGITFLVGEDAVTYAVDGPTIRVDDGQSSGDTVVRLSRPAWDDMVGQVRTIINLLLSDDLAFERDGFEQLADWDPVLRYPHAGIPPYDPARIDLRGRDPFAAFTPDAQDAELAAQLDTMGYLHVKGVFTGDEMDAANREVDRLAAAARPGDDRSWWVTGEDGGHVLCRLVYATLRSPVLAALEGDPRVRRLGTLLEPRAARRARPDGGQRGAAQSAGKHQWPVQHPLAPGLRDGWARDHVPRGQRRDSAHRLGPLDRQPAGASRQPRPGRSPPLGTTAGRGAGREHRHRPR